MMKTPKLRFKEFSGEWESKKLGELGEFKKTYSFSRSVEGEGNYKHIHYGDVHMNYKGIISKDRLIPSINIPHDNKYEFVRTKDIIFADASEDRKDLGKVAVVRQVEGNVLSGLHTICFRPKETLNSEFFLNHSLNKEYLKFMYTRGNGAKVLGISKSNLSEYKFLAPSKEEQEKIASFFSLIDGKISLQGEKLKMLKDYKSGMMQKIFSRKLRFKDDDGRDYPEWEEKKLGNLLKSVSSGKTKIKNEVGTYKVYGSMGVIGYTEDKDYESEHILIARVGANAGTVNIIDEPCGISDNTLVVKCKNEIDCKFLYYKLNQYNLSRLVFGSGQPLITGGQVKSINIYVPSLKEQLKIAKYLYIIENKLEKEQEKLDYLNEYKKGLLQQMFV